MVCLCINNPFSLMSFPYFVKVCCFSLHFIMISDLDFSFVLHHLFIVCLKHFISFKTCYAYLQLLLPINIELRLRPYIRKCLCIDSSFLDCLNDDEIILIMK